MKIIAFYLPQFHQIPENDEWWGKGFTEWTNVKKAIPLFDGHQQPVIPYNNNYYDLSNVETIRWQANLANEYGIYGFCIYHYWFGGKLLLQKPMELIRENEDINIKYCICWANEHWTNSWVSKSEQVLIEQEYGSETDWIEHFNYLEHFFSDSRYIKEDGKPLVVIYRPEIIPCLNDMLECWEKCAKQKGYSGLIFAYQHIGFDLIRNKDDSQFAYDIEYQPMYAMTQSSTVMHKIAKKITSKINQSFIGKINANVFSAAVTKVRTMDYDNLWSTILNMPVKSKNIPGAFVRWDNTPRKGVAGIVTTGVTADKFQQYMIRQIYRAKEDYKSDKLFVFAWNEWAEGGYLEPDEANGYSYLQAIKNALEITQSLEN